jgi:streptomycin 6-kinase
LNISDRLAAACQGNEERMAWLARLPDVLRALEQRWSFTVEAPFEGGSCAWVAPVTLANGSCAVLKLGMHHMEGEDEAEGLRFWDGDPTVQLLDRDDLGAVLMERCRPGNSLRSLPEPEQDIILATLLRRMWKPHAPSIGFRPLSRMIEHWSNETLSARAGWKDVGLVEEGLRFFELLSSSAPREVLLATDLHAGNVLRAERQPWLVIDPKPFVGDAAYDATQHLFNCLTRLQADPQGMIRRFADLLEVEEQRVRWWTFARAAAELRADWNDRRSRIARKIAP